MKINELVKLQAKEAVTWYYQNAGNFVIQGVNC